MECTQGIITKNIAHQMYQFEKHLKRYCQNQMDRQLWFKYSSNYCFVINMFLPWCRYEQQNKYLFDITVYNICLSGECKAILKRMENYCVEQDVGHSAYIVGGSLERTWKLGYSDLKFSKISFDEILALSLYLKVQ